MCEKNIECGFIANLRPENCHKYVASEQDIVIISQPGQDQFYMPGLHVADSLSRCVQMQNGDFSLSVKCQLVAHAKFDGAGIYFENGMHRLKFGIEHYGAGSPRVVSVKSSPYSDEANGTILDTYSAVLVISRQDKIISCYTMLSGKMKFERAFVIDKMEHVNIIGFYVQAPFANQPAQGEFKEVVLNSTPVSHQRT